MDKIGAMQGNIEQKMHGSIEPKQSNNIWKKAIGYTAGITTAAAVGKSASIFTYPIIKYLPKPTEAESKILEGSFDKVLNAFDLKNKNLSFVMNSGMTAFDSESKKLVMIATDSIGKELAIFHELGHAHNSYFGKISKHLQCLRQIPKPVSKIGIIAAIVSGVLLSTALLTNSKEKNDNVFDKTTSFIKTNIGKIIFATFIPTLLEEAVASVKAAKFSKAFLTKNVYNKMNKNNLLCFSTYLITAMMAGIGASLAVKVKDKIVG